MTSEQITNLKGRLDERCADGEGINVTREDVERLLDEREALLGALKALDHHPHNETSECWRNALSAIAKAESP